jgi:purine-nucleoside phosphorylase
MKKPEGSIVKAPAFKGFEQKTVLYIPADGVDMETSAVFALAEFRGIRAASLLIVSDELNELGHNRAFNHPRMPEILQEYFLPFIRERSE